MTNAEAAKMIAEMAAETMALSHEELQTRFAEAGHGCKTCDRTVAPTWWVTIDGDVHCEDDAEALEKLGVDLKMIFTERQIAARMSWDVQGIGTN